MTVVDSRQEATATGIAAGFKRTKKLSLFRQSQTDASSKTFQSTGSGHTLQTPRLKPAFRRNSDTANVLLVIPCLSLCLGIWQVRRYFWKKDLVKEMTDKMNREPIPLPSSLEEINNMEYVKVRVRGTFDHMKEMFIVPRSNVHPSNSKDLRDMGRQSGVYVVTPFKLSDRNWSILVNRGWVPPNRRNPVSRLKGQVVKLPMCAHQNKRSSDNDPLTGYQVPGEVELVGVIRKNEKKALFLSEEKDNSFPDSYRYRNIDVLATAAETELVFIDADFASTVQGGPIGGQTRLQLRDQHISYAATWFALAGVTYIMWKKSFRRPNIAKFQDSYWTKK